MTEKQREIIEGLNWRIHEWSYSDGEKVYELQKASPAGEDFSFSVDGEHLIELIQSMAAEFDPDAHAEEWVAARQRGTDKTIPDIRTLIKDADAIKEMLEELAKEISQKGWEETK